MSKGFEGLSLQVKEVLRAALETFETKALAIANQRSG